MPLGPEVVAGLAALARGVGGAHEVAVAKDAQAQYLASLEDRASGASLRVVTASARRPLSMYRLILDTQPGARGDVHAVVVCVLEPRRCDATTRVAAQLQPVKLGSVPILWVLVADPEDAQSAGSTTTPRSGSSARPSLPPGVQAGDSPSPAVEKLIAAGAALGRRFSVNELATVLKQPAGALIESLELAISSGTLRPDAHELVFASERAWRAVRDRQDTVQWSEFIAAAIDSHVASQSIQRLRDLLVDAELDHLPTDVFERVWDVLARSDFLAAAELCRRRSERGAQVGLDVEDLQAKALLLEIQAGLPGLIAEYAPKLEDIHPPAIGAAVAEALVVPHPYEAMQLARRTLDRAAVGSADHARLHALIATCQSLFGDIDQAYLEHVAALVEATGDRRALSLANFATAVAMAADGDPLSVLNRIALGNEAPANETLGPAGWLSGTFRAKTLVDLGRIAESEQVIDACADYVEGRGQMAALPHVIMSRAVFAMEQGRLLDAAHGLHAARHIGLAIGLVEFSEANILSRLIQLARMRGDIAELDRLGATLETHLEDERSRLDAVEKGLALADDPEPVEWRPRWATRTAAPALDVAVLSDTSTPHTAPTNGRSGYSLLLALHDLLATFRSSVVHNDQTGDASAYAVLAQVATSTGLPFPMALADHASGLVNGDAGRVARAMEIYQDLRRPLLEVQALEDLAYLASDRDGSVAALERARESWQAMGATREAARMDRYLRTLGVRPSVVSVSDQILDLSAAEERVVRELMAGRSNAEIAEALQLSKNTVAVHLSRIYSRAGVANRAALVDLVRSLQEVDR